MRLHSAIIPLQLVFWCCLIAWMALPAASAAENATAVHWLAVESRHTLILYQAHEDLERFDRQLRFGPGGGSLKRLFSEPKSAGLHDAVAVKIDALFERVQEILGMRRMMKRTTIFVHPDRRQLHAAYERLYNRPCTIRAWYQFSTNGVYVNARDLNEGMLAHELAHAIIDHYLLVRPPAATAAT